MLGCHPEPKSSFVGKHRIGGEPRWIIQENTCVSEDPRVFTEFSKIVVPTELYWPTPVVGLPCNARVFAVGPITIPCATTRFTSDFLLEAIPPSIRASWCGRPSACCLMARLSKKCSQFQFVVLAVTSVGKLRKRLDCLHQRFICKEPSSRASAIVDVREECCKIIFGEPR